MQSFKLKAFVLINVLFQAVRTSSVVIIFLINNLNNALAFEGLHGPCPSGSSR
jgi:hypothetical protein